MKNRNELIRNLEVALLGLGSLLETELDKKKRREIENISARLSNVIEELRAGNSISNSEVAWRAIEESLIKFGIKEIAEALLELL